MTRSQPRRLEGGLNNSARGPSSDGPPLVAAFDDGRHAEEAAGALRDAGLRPSEVWLMAPPHIDWVGLRALPHYQRDAAVATGLGQALVDAGVADGPARFYEREFAAGKSLVLVLPGGRSPKAQVTAEALLHRHGGRDLEQIGGELARAAELDTPPTTIRLAPVESRLTWSDVAPHYETFFDQRYGVGNASWAEYEGSYQFAWELANQPEYRGQRWSEVAGRVRRAWRKRGTGLEWEQVAGGMGDVWQDVIDDVEV